MLESENRARRRPSGRPLPTVPQILEGIELEEVVDCLPSVHQVLSNREGADSGPDVVQRSSNRPRPLTLDEASVEAFAINRSPHGQPARTTRLLPPPYGSYHPPRAAPVAAHSAHPLLQQPPASTAEGSRLTAAPAAPVIVVTDPDGDQRALSTEDDFLFPVPPPVYSPPQLGIPLPHVAEEPRGQAYAILEFRERQPRRSTVQSSHLSPHWQPRLVRNYSSFAGGYPQDNGMGHRGLSPSPSPPGSEVVTVFDDQPARTAKCDVCDGRNTSGMSRCTVCKWQCCHNCTIRKGLRRSHIAGNVVHVAPITREELLQSSTEASRSTGKTKRKNKTKKVGGGARASANARNNRGLDSVGTATEARYNVEASAGSYKSFVDGEVIVRDFGALPEAEGTANIPAGRNCNHREPIAQGELQPIRTFPKPKKGQQVVSAAPPRYSHELIWGPPAGIDDAFTHNADRVHPPATPPGRPDYIDQELKDAGELLTFSTAATAIEAVERGIHLAAGGIPDKARIIEDASALAEQEVEEYKQGRALAGV
ncbi:uncharacterized protein BO66DRAFT_425472 [Aspergillus aculeatinus CBS 121060]|uniref:Uncharacterized protein n=1 Tax=Aspergillus aculeatinus CBS 121060 TaxID=1448322 RepID=A0ACD1HKT1_9EURO|nr:hypothetical protein BO66DRAFT_425472 [Aspergillus aculeatinus CBS 121060]RAH74469.1 hypothetical protein BO66DRAFT_425472 [Aspergillus aculeatinus CBS 121060]